MLVAGKTSKEDAKGFELFISRSPVADFNDKFTVFGKLLNGGIIQAVEVYSILSLSIRFC